MPKSSKTPIVPLPEKFEIINGFDSITIRRRWFSAVAFFLLFFSIIWNGFMIFWMTAALRDGISTMAAFGSLHAAVGIGLLYTTLTLFLNKTDITINATHLSVRHFPLPWPGKRKIATHEITQLYCKEKRSQNKNGVTITYEVHVITTGDRQKKLISGLTDSTQARYIEHEIERTLGLKDKPVSGELH